MGSERLTALTDGVVAVIMTIMVLELKPPHGTDLASLSELWPTFLSFALSFVYVAIYWNNHHHFFKLVKKVDGAVMWANLNLLFWLSLIPFTTAWMDEHSLAALPIAVYGGSLIFSALSWYLMQLAIVRLQGPDSQLKRALGRDVKGKLTPLFYLLDIALAFAQPLAPTRSTPARRCCGSSRTAGWNASLHKRLGEGVLPAPGPDLRTAPERRYPFDRLSRP